MGLGAPLDTLASDQQLSQDLPRETPPGMGSGAGSYRRLCSHSPSSVVSAGNLPRAVQGRALNPSAPTGIRRGLAAPGSSCHMEMDFLLSCKKSQGDEGKPFPWLPCVSWDSAECRSGRVRLADPTTFGGGRSQKHREKQSRDSPGWLLARSLGRECERAGRQTDSIPPHPASSRRFPEHPGASRSIPVPFPAPSPEL